MSDLSYLSHLIMNLLISFDVLIDGTERTLQRFLYLSYLSYLPYMSRSS